MMKKVNKGFKKLFEMDSPFIGWIIWILFFLVGNLMAEIINLRLTLHIYGINRIYIQEIVMDLVIIFGFLILSFYENKPYFFFNWDNLLSNNFLAWGIILFYLMICVAEVLKNSFSFLAMLTALIVAIAEEMAFRGEILIRAINWIHNKYSSLFGILLSSGIFAISHLVNITVQPVKVTLIQLITTFSVGIILGTIYLTSGNFIFPVAIHFLIDLSAFTANNGMNSSVNSFLPCIILLAIAILILSVQIHNDRLDHLEKLSKQI